jgi:hypothetical protein
MSTMVKTECGEMLPLDETAADTYGRMGLKVAIRYLPLETILQVGPCFTARERELSCVADDLGTTLRETRWETVD